MDTATNDRIDHLYRRTKLMPWVSALGLFVPIVLLCASPLGLMYLYQLRRLLKKMDASQENHMLADVRSSSDPSLLDKVAYIRKRKWYLLIPTFILGFYFVCAVYSIASIVLNDPRL